MDTNVIMLVGVLCAVIISGVLGMILDTIYYVEFKGVYWVIGIIGGIICGASLMFGFLHRPGKERRIMDYDKYEYIRTHYNVPCKYGARVEYNGKPGTVIGVINAYAKVRLDGDKKARPYHPADLTWL